MIVRILGEGQYDVPDDSVAALNELDDAVESAVEAGDEATFRSALEALLAGVRDHGTHHPDDSLDESDLILPPGDATHRRGARAPRRRRPHPRLTGAHRPLMATNRFIKDSGLTARMTLVMFLLGALFVALVVGMMYAVNSPGLAMLIGIGGIGVAFYQWWSLRQGGHAGDARPRGHARGGPRAARHDRPALRPGRHAQAAGRHRRHGPAQRLRDRSLARPRGRVRDDRHPPHPRRRGARGRAGPRAQPRRPPRRPRHDDRLVRRHRRRDADPRRPVRRPGPRPQQRRAAPGCSSRSPSAWPSTPSASCCSACSRATASCAPTGRVPT